MKRGRTLQITKRFLLALSVLALLVTPAFARDDDWGEEHHGRHEHERFEGRFFVPVPVPEPYAMRTCYVQPGHWVQQPYTDQWGYVSYARQWVPAQEVCN